MESRRQSRHSATRVAAAMAQEAICTLMSSSADKEFEATLQSYSGGSMGKSSGKTTTKRDVHGNAVEKTPSSPEPGEIVDGKSDIINGKTAKNMLLDQPKRDSMYEAYQIWALKTYGDSAKTKTVTKKKYHRIMKILQGEETNVENSKFRFWVKAKGFKVGPSSLVGHNFESRLLKLADQVLYVPCSKQTVAEMYAFLPREAVTRFLMSCSDCQKRMHLQANNSSGSNNNNNATCNGSIGKSNRSCSRHEASDGCSGGGSKPTLDIDYSLPLTTTIKRMRNAGFVYNLMGDSLMAPNSIDGQELDEEMISETGASDADNNGDGTCGNSDDALCEEITAEDDDDDDGDDELAVDCGELDEEAVPLDMSRVKCENSSVCFEQPINMSSKRAKMMSAGKTMSSGSVAALQNDGGALPDRGFNERWGHNGTAAKNNADDEDEDDEDDNDLQLAERLSEQSGTYDPERLKAFNMFVRLFVDENLDRLVPISRQPKEKIQAIIESCTRQFPEFAERARKRIRTYLKSCRRTKRHKTAAAGDGNGRWNDSSTVKSPGTNHVSYHLTSPMAEQILATACENECQNAKRMRMGLKPLAVSINEVTANGSTSSRHPTPTPSNCGQNATSTSASAVQVFQQNSANSSNLLTFPYQQCLGSTEKGGAMVNGSLTGHSSGGKTTSGNHYSLNPSEVAAVKQLIAGYRESAAFLLRSADELEQLILQQN